VKKYGIPYMGSKSRIADKIINVLPAEDTFVDLFAGGCAMTHCAMECCKYNNFIINDISDI
jgi:site-specific DNA-adenine methylase